MTFRTRFAPSPTGPLHLGHAFSAILAHDMARQMNGEFLLRIEDIDQSRSRTEWEDQIFADLHWLDLHWSEPVMRQTDRHAAYRNALETLWTSGALYPCTCNRRDILAAISAPQEGAELPTGPDGLIYPGTCRSTSGPQTAQALPDEALRLNMGFACNQILKKPSFSFVETGTGPNGETGTITFSAQDAIDGIGDIVLSRREMGTSYHLSVVLDDAKQDITHVVRGQDLFEATKIHVILQHLLGLPTPIYHHHRLIRDENGKRLAKRDDARAIRTYRDDGASPQDIRRLVGL